MAVLEAKPVKKAKTPRVNACQCPTSSRISVQEMEKELGLDKVRAIVLSPSTQPHKVISSSPSGCRAIGV